MKNGKCSGKTNERIFLFQSSKHDFRRQQETQLGYPWGNNE